MYDVFAFIFQHSSLLRGSLLFILGIVLGSFLNVVIYRLPLILVRNWTDECKVLLQEKLTEGDLAGKLNLFHPGSHCPSCNGKIPFWANVPILGYIFLGGHCYRCKCKISITYPIIELVTGLLFVCAGDFFLDPLLLSSILIFTCFIIVIIVIDYQTLILPDELTLPLLWLGILFNLHGAIAGSLENSVLGAVIGYLFLFTIFWLFKLVTKKDGMGYGDFKLLAAIGAFGGYAWLSPVIFLAAVLGVIYFIIGKLSGRFSYQEQIPFGSFLGIAGLIMFYANKYIYLLYVSL